MLKKKNKDSKINHNTTNLTQQSFVCHLILMRTYFFRSCNWCVHKFYIQLLKFTIRTIFLVATMLSINNLVVSK